MSATTLRGPPPAAGPGTRGDAARAAPYGAAVATVLLASSHVAVDGVLGGVTALGPSLQERLAVGERGLALLVAALWAAGSLTQPAFGVVADRIGAARVAAVGAAATGIFVGAVVLVRSSQTALALLVLGGLASGAFHPAAAALVHAVPTRRPGVALSVFGAGGAVGLAIGPVAVLAVTAAAGLSAAAWGGLAGLAAAGLLLAAGRRRSATQPAPFSPRHLPLLLRGPVGVLTVVAVLASLPPITFAAAMPLVLTGAGHTTDAPVIGWTLGVDNVAAAAGGIAAVAASSRISPSALVAGSLLASVPAVALVLALPPGGLAYYAAVAAAGALGNAVLPLVILAAQRLAPYAVATAAGLIGGAVGVAALGYIAVGAVQEAIGVAPAIHVAYLAVAPAALLTVMTARRHTAFLRPAASTPVVCACAPCLCGTCPRSLVGHP